MLLDVPIDHVTELGGSTLGRADAKWIDTFIDLPPDFLRTFARGRCGPFRPGAQLVAPLPAVDAVIQRKRLVAGSVDADGEAAVQSKAGS